jgi:hypothetical protein
MDEAMLLATGTSVKLRTQGDYYNEQWNEPMAWVRAGTDSLFDGLYGRNISACWHPGTGYQPRATR